MTFKDPRCCLINFGTSRKEIDKRLTVVLFEQYNTRTKKKKKHSSKMREKLHGILGLWDLGW